MTTTHGFELIEARDIPEINTKARLFQHVRTGARLLSLENDDENKSFAITFKTPPDDDTGLPHILEHTVLTGSRKYPTKEPFVELLKTSLQTFLNAMTADDMTLYPVASTNLQDFYNLVDVYLDAVFYPTITPEKLKQEGWHYENETLEDADTPLIYKGVVFNEMKSVMSTPDYVMGHHSQASILPDTPYARNSGGDPRVIPQLTFEQFKQFHETYYHPSNAFITFYGDDDPEERLRLIDDFISEFERRDIDATLPQQPRFDAPRTETHKYDAGEADDSGNKAMTTVNWLLDEIDDAERVLSLQILEHILIGTPASPLRKALIESGIGEDLVGGGLDTLKREATFSVGLKGIKASDAEKVESLVLDTLANLADNGIDRATIDASINTVEFKLRERNTGMFPRGLMTSFQILSSWVHFDNPLEALAFEDKLNRIKEQAQNGSGYFEDMIGKYFLDNNHRTTVKLIPDPSVGPAREADERARLDEFAATLSDEDRQRIRDEAVALKTAQETPDKPEDIAKIPTLTLDDIDRQSPTIPIEEQTINGATVLYHDLPTSGIVYLNLAFDLRGVPLEKLPYAQLLTRAILEMGTDTEDYVQLSQRIGAQTGGINADTNTGAQAVDGGYYAYFGVTGKAMLHQSGALLGILKDVLFRAKLDDKARFKQIVLEEKANKEAYAGLAGHGYVMTRLRAAFNAESHAKEMMGGFSYLFFLRELAERIDSDWEGVLNELEAVRSAIINRGEMLVNVTLDEAPYRDFRPQLESFIESVPAGGSAPVEWTTLDQPDYEALVLPAQVNFVGKVLDVGELGYKEHGSYIAIFKHMNLDYMWTRIRVQGGAYGGAAQYNPYDDTLTFVSWRDPNLLKTLDVYNNTGAYLKSIQLDRGELDKAIIGAIGQLDKYMLPDMKGYTSMVRYLAKVTDEARQQRRDELLNTSVADFHRLGEALSDITTQGKAAAVTSPDAAKNANAKGGQFVITKVM